MNFLRKSMADVTAALLHRLLPIISLRVMGHERRWVGKCTFYGPVAFLNICEEAMHVLDERDPALSRSIRLHNYVFWYDRKRLIRFEKHFSINDAFQVWGSLGIVAMLVYAHYKTVSFQGKVFPLFEHTEVRGLNKAVRARTKTWLIMNASPLELIECFED